jgi:Predicted membrane protein
MASSTPEGPAPAASKRTAWIRLWQIVTKVQPEKIDPVLALRNTAGVGLPLFFGLLIGDIEAAVAVSAGALTTSFSDSSDPYPHRGRRMFLVSLLVAIAVSVGALSAEQHAIAVAVATLWAFAAGMLVLFGTHAADMGLISLVTLVVFAGHYLPPEHALSAGLLALAGGLLQTVLSVALWPIRRYEPERRALADLYQELSRVAAGPIRASEAPPATAQAIQARAALDTPGRGHSLESNRYRSLLNQAERMRLSMLALARLRTRLDRENPNDPAGKLLERCFILTAEILSSVASALVSGQPPVATSERLAEVQQLAEELRAVERTERPALAAMIRDARHQIDALAGQLRAAVDLAAYATPAGQAAFEERQTRQPWQFRIRGTMAVIRANLSLRSAAWRHAIRMAACVGIGDALARSLPWQRSYWLPMTIAIVLRPDFASTFSRGTLRLAGTFAGLVVSTGLFHLLHPALGLQVLLIAVLTFLLRCFGPANYGIFVTAVTALTVFMVAIVGGVAPSEVINARALNTVVGGSLALAAYLIWPTWERTQVPEAMASMLDAYRDYFRAVRDHYTHPEIQAPHKLDRARAASRLARSNLEASVDRFSAEPGASPARLSTLRAMLASSHRLIHAIMALEAGLSTSHPVPPRKMFHTFADHVELTLYCLAAALRSSMPLHVENLPDLREDHHALVHSGDSLTERYALVNVETDRITNSLNTLAEQTLQWLEISMTQSTSRQEKTEG